MDYKPKNWTYYDCNLNSPEALANTCTCVARGNACLNLSAPKIDQSELLSLSQPKTNKGRFSPRVTQSYSCAKENSSGVENGPWSLRLSWGKATLIPSVFVPIDKRSWNEPPWKVLIWSPKITDSWLNCACLISKKWPTNFLEVYFWPFVLYFKPINRSCNGTFSHSFCQACAVRNQDTRCEKIGQKP